MASLFQTIGDSHDVTEEQVRRSLGQRRKDLDVVVIVSFIGFYAWASDLIVRRVCRRYSDRRETSVWVAMIIYASVIASAVGVILGEQWSGLLENFRIGNGHLSYRGERIPWSHHRFELFVGGLILFWFLAVLHHRKRSASLGILGQTRLRITPVTSGTSR